MRDTPKKPDERMWSVEEFIAALKKEEIDDIIDKTHGLILRSKEMEEQLCLSEARYRRIVESQTELICLQKPDRTVTFVNEAYRRFFGCNDEDILGKKFLPEYYGPMPENTAYPIDPTGKGYDISGKAFEWKVSVDGKSHWIRWIEQKIYDAEGRWVEIQSIGRDITKRILIEEKYKELAGALERRVMDRTAELTKRSRQLQHLMMELSKTEERERERIALFLHDDIQQHLAALKLRLDMIPFPEKMNPETVKQLDFCISLTGDAIDKVRKITDELSLKTLKKNGFLAILHECKVEMSEKHGLDVAIDIKRPEDVEPLNLELASLLYHCVKELLFNVVKHSGERSACIEVRVEEDRLLIGVKDSGKGFDVQETIDTRGKKGGFGLFSIEERIRYIGGNLKVDSSPGKGCAIEISVPILRDTESSAGNEPLSQAVLSPLKPKTMTPLKTGGEKYAIRILVADDHMAVRQGLIKLLERYEDLYVVAEATTGLEAIHMTDRHRPDVILMDVFMPDMTGIEATVKIRQDYPKVAVIGLSMDSDPSTRSAMIKAGAAGYLSKSDAFKEVVRAVRDAVGSDQSPRSHDYGAPGS